MEHENREESHRQRLLIHDRDYSVNDLKDTDKEIYSDSDEESSQKSD